MTRLEAPLELWGGPECTVNRVGDLYRDQTRETGHHRRPQDLARFAELGIAALRYPVVWERVAPHSLEKPNWKWCDRRLAQIARLGMRPIAGLLHHGSGPAYTSLIAEDFASLFARYAGMAAQRYPWITDWTPVNEPLTTARFSALYGFWYPHGRDEKLFWHAFLNQIEAVAAAMGAIRSVIPEARLIQTEDLGEILSTPGTQAQAAFQNERRWLTWDLLAGKVTPSHPLWKHIAGFGFEERLRAIADKPCPPQVIGVNHYLTSNRFLDDRQDCHPGLKDRGYVDIEAIRVHAAPPGLEALLRQTWSRYGLPIAVTESHNHCTRDEQMRWMHEAWQAALNCRRDAVDVVAVTSWALAGSCDWSSLLMRRAGVYEVGAFDIRGAKLRPTAMTRMLRGLARGEPPATEPMRTVLATPGWWKRKLRFTHRPFPAPSEETAEPAGTPLLITGATGRLGQAFAQACSLRGLPWRATFRGEADLVRPDTVSTVLGTIRPWAVINAAGWSRVDAAEDQPSRCFDVNARGAQALAAACAQRDIPCVSFSSDLVFNGKAGRAYRESDAPDPLNVYGSSKRHCEEGVTGAGGRQLIIRSSAFFSTSGPADYAHHVATSLTANRRVYAPDDCVVTATYLPDLAHAVLDLLLDGETGLWHLSNHDPLSWAAFAQRLAQALNLDGDLVMPVPSRKMAWRAARPAYAALSTQHGDIMPGLDDALARFALAYRSDAVRGCA